MTIIKSIKKEKRPENTIIKIDENLNLFQPVINGIPLSCRMAGIIFFQGKTAIGQVVPVVQNVPCSTDCPFLEFIACYNGQDIYSNSSPDSVYIVFNCTSKTIKKHIDVADIDSEVFNVLTLVLNPS